MHESVDVMCQLPLRLITPLHSGYSGPLTPCSGRRGVGVQLPDVVRDSAVLFKLLLESVLRENPGVAGERGVHRQRWGLSPPFSTIYECA